MADNFTADAGSGGDTFAADDVGGAKYPRGKLSLGADGTVVDAVGGTGTDSTAVQRVTLATDIALPTGTNSIGKIGNGAVIGAADPTIDSYTNIALNLSAGANQQLVAAPGASKQIWVYGVGFSVDTAATSVSFQDEDDTAVSGIMLFAQYGGMAFSPSGNFAMPLWKIATNKALEVDLVTGGFDGTLAYAIASV